MIVFALLAVLLMPDGGIQVLNLGDGMTRDKCDLEARRAEIQLDQTLSVAKIVSVECRRSIES